MTQAPSTHLDPVTFEVIKHKLWAMVDEQAIALKSVSGSAVVTESNDFNVGFFTATGEVISVGRFILTQARTTASIVRSIVREYADNPGIAPGDMFICNDPYMGALHPPDVSIAAPIFYRDQLVAWAGCCAHQLDMGGMDFGSWCSRATERQQEAMILSAVKFMERGRIRKDIWTSIMSMSRLPFLIGLDFRAMIAANNLGTRRFLALVERYGLETVQAVVAELLDTSEARMRERLRELPDGVYRAVDYLDHDGHQDRLYRVELTLTKEADRIHFDFAGSSPQAPGFVNCTESGLVAGVCAGFIPILAYDIPFNEGLMRPFTIVAPPGTICNAQSPAPGSMASVGAVYAVTSVVVSALSQMVACSGRPRTEAQARPRGSMAVLNLGGKDQYGEPFGTMDLGGIAGGGGAFSFKDGLQSCGTFSMLEPNIANVETTENFAPVLYLYRRLVPDSGGAGEFRGGLSMGYALTPHDVDELQTILISHGVSVPNATGLFGGLPGCCTANRLLRNSDLPAAFARGVLPGRIDDLHGELLDLGAKPGRIRLEPGDVLDTLAQGGGGWGDPLLRAPEAVVADVAQGAVSVEAAQALYGVVVQPAFDPVATQARREGLRRQRLERAGQALAQESSPGGRVPLSLTPALSQGEREPIGGTPLGGQLRLAGDPDAPQVVCTCGHVFGPASQNWKLGAALLRAEPRAAGPLLRLRDELELRLYLCPACGLQHAVEIAEVGSPPRWEVALGPKRSRQSTVDPEGAHPTA